MAIAKLTPAGLAAFNSASPEEQIQLVTLAVGDGILTNDSIVLVNQRWSGPCSNPEVVATVPNKIIKWSAVIPADVGGFTVRECALTDSNGNVVLIAETETVTKPVPGGVGSEMIVEMYHTLINQEDDLVIDFYSGGFETNASKVSNSGGGTTQEFINSFALKIFQSPTVGLTEISTRTLLGGEVYEVRKVSDDSLATIYSDAGGLNPITQNGTNNVSGSAGVVEFYVADGDYYIAVDAVTSNFSVGSVQRNNQSDGGFVYKGSNGQYLRVNDVIPSGADFIVLQIGSDLVIVQPWEDITLPAAFTSVTANTQRGYDVVTSAGTLEFVDLTTYALRAGNGGAPYGSGYAIPKGADQGNLADFQSKFPVRVNPDPIFGGFIGINNPQCGSVLDLASFGGQGIPGFNPIGFVLHHYSDSRMVQMDNVGSNNEILYLKNANNPTRRADQATDYIGSGKFISANRQESDGAGGVTGTLEGFYLSKDFELVWPMQATGVNTVRLWNNVAAGSEFWTHEFKNTHEQQFLFRIDNGGTNHFEVEWFEEAQSTRLVVSNAMQIKAENGDLVLDADGGIIKFTQVARKVVFSRSTLPTLTSAHIGAEAYLQDGSDLYPIHWNGSSWRKVSDNTPA